MAESRASQDLPRRQEESGIRREPPGSQKHRRAGADVGCSSWVEEVTHDGQRSWYNVVSGEISWSRPLNMKPCVWEKDTTSAAVARGKTAAAAAAAPTAPQTASGEVVYIHKETGERVPRKRSSRSVWRVGKMKVESEANVVVDESQTALGKKLLVMTAEDLAAREGHMGSTRSLLDRKIFARDFRLYEHRDGRAELESQRTRTVVARLDASETRLYKTNPHIQQVFANGRPFRRADHVFTLADRHAARDDEGKLTPRTPYARRQGEVKTVDHWGQRKLLLSEIEFLTLYGHLAKTVVYAGAAPGTHIDFLSRELFPEHKWVLVDPAPFDARDTDMIQVRQAFFTDDVAQEFAGQDLLFICDIRSMDEGLEESVKEQRVQVDMIWQEKWGAIMKPKASMLKFRLPYPPPEGTTEYLDGDIFLPVWGGRTTSETRLIVTDVTKRRVYNHKEYEDYMFHFNTETRTTYWDHNCRGEGLDHCYDCMSEIFILQTWLRKFKVIEDEGELQESVERLSMALSRRISNTGRTLALF